MTTRYDILASMIVEVIKECCPDLPDEAADSIGADAAYEIDEDIDNQLGAIQAKAAKR